MKNKVKLISILLSISIILSFPLLSFCHDSKNYFFENPYGICITPGEDETMLNFSWYSKKDNDSKIKIFNEFGEEKTYKGKSKKLDNNFVSNKVTVTNLKDNTTYYYSYKLNGVWSRPIEYKTKNSLEFSFAFMADPQIGASSRTLNSVEEGIKKDVLSWNKVINKALQKENNLSFIVCGGDETNTKEENQKKISNQEYSGYLSPYYLQYTPIANVIGNHDKDNENFYNHFYMPNSSSLGKNIAGGDYYFKYGNTLFLFLNTNNLNINEHKQFIENTLKKNEDVKWKIALFHHDIYGDGIHSQEKDIKQLRNTLPQILEKNKINLALCGHDHIYSRTYTLKNNKKTKEFIIERFDDFNEKVEIINNSKGITYITGGSCTGSKFYKSTNNKSNYVKFKYDEENPLYTIINVSKDKIIIKTYKVNSDEMIDSKIIINK